MIASLWKAGAAAGDLCAGLVVLTAVHGFVLKIPSAPSFFGLSIHVEHLCEVDESVQCNDNQAHVGKSF